MTRTLPAKIPLCVPPWDEAEALAEGAKYDKSFGFYAEPTAHLDALWTWLPRRYRDLEAAALLPEMLPDSTWEKNVRHLMGQEVWDRMRRHAYKAAGYRCEICGTQGALEAHEWFELDDSHATQRLKRVIALCPLCHKVHHLGIARRLGMLAEVRSHMKTVNGWTDSELETAIAEAYDVWAQRCQWHWHVDLSWLYRSGYIHV